MSDEVTPVDVRKIRASRTWTQEELAAELGTDAVTVSRWERGVSEPRPAARQRLIELIIGSGPHGQTAIVEDATERIRKLESALRQMKELKRRIKPLT